MSWAGLANNQCVSNANLDNAITTGVFVRKSAFNDSNQELTKERAQDYVYLNENLTSFLNKALNQLVVKQDLQAATIIGCGTGTYGTIQWIANTLIKTTQYFDVGTTSGTITIDYTVVTGFAQITVIYGGSNFPVGIITNVSGSTTYPYTYNSGVGTIIGITFQIRSNPAVTQNFSVRASCPVPPTTTTTSTTTTSTTAASYFVTFYGRMGDQSNSAGVLYFSTDQTNWTPVAQPFYDTCGVIDAFLINSGDTVYVSIGDPSSTVYYYNAQLGTTCPSNSATYCGNGNRFSVVINGDTDIAITQYVAGGDILAC